MKDRKEAFQLIDVREPYEVELCAIGGENIPLGSIVQRLDHIRKDVPVVIHCRSGNRSAAVINALETRYGYTNMLNLAGGIHAYGREVDPALRCE
jgi:adenylyltransferase/sulfurtransferase